VFLLFGFSEVLGGPADQYREDFIYDELGRLKQKTYFDADVQQREIFSYDAVGNRVLKAVAGTFFLIDGDSSFNNAEQETVAIRRMGDITAAQRIDLDLNDITATAGIDYRYWFQSDPSTVYVTDSPTITLDFAANDGADKVLVIEGLPSLVFGDSFSISLSNLQQFDGSVYGPATNAAVVIPTLTYIANDDEMGVLGPARFVFAGNVTASEGSTAIVTIKRKGDPTTAHNVVVKTRQGTAVSGTDYTAVDTTLAFAANEITKTVSIPVATDSASEVNETFAVHMEVVDNGGTIGTPDTATVTIAGTGPPASSIRVIDAVVMEGSTVQVHFVRAGSLPVNDTIKYRTINGSATGGVDFTTANPTDLVWSFGQNLQTITLTTTQDTTVEGDEYLWIYAYRDGSGSPGFTDPIARIRIIDDDGTPPGTVAPTSPVSFAFTGNVTVTEGQTAMVTINRTGDTASTHNVSVSVLNGTTQTGGSADYIPVSDSVLQFAAGETSKTISIETLVDGASEIDETFTVMMNSVNNGATFGSPQSALVTITGTAVPGSQISVGDASVAEGSAVNVTFTRTGSTSSSQTIKYHTRNGTAAYTDYSPSHSSGDYSDTVTFGAGVTSVTKSITATQDTVVEGEEYLWIYLEHNGSNNPGISQPTAKVKVVDDDSATNISIADQTVAEGGTATLTVTRSVAGFWQYIPYTTVDSTAQSADDYTSKSGYAVFAPGDTTATIEITTAQDTSAEGDEAFLVNITAGDGYTTLTDGSALVTITDDD